MLPELCISELQECEETIRSYRNREWGDGERYHGLNINLSRVTYDDLTSFRTRAHGICRN